MIAFEVSVNGRRICIAALEDGLLRFGVDYVTPNRAIEEEDRLWMHVGGISRRYEHRRWPVPSIGIGDEVTVRIIEADGPDRAPICEPYSA